MTLKTYVAIYDHGRLLWDADERPPEERARVMVTVVESLEGDDDTAHDGWIELSRDGLASAYGPDEPVYTLDDLRVQ